MGFQQRRGRGNGSQQPDPTGSPARPPVLCWQEARGCVCVGGTFCVCRDLGAASCFRQSACMGSIWEQNIPHTHRSVQGCTRVGV